MDLMERIIPLTDADESEDRGYVMEGIDCSEEAFIDAVRRIFDSEAEYRPEHVQRIYAKWDGPDAEERMTLTFATRSEYQDEPALILDGYQPMTYLPSAVDL
jgi:hypothetical protein